MIDWLSFSLVHLSEPVMDTILKFDRRTGETTQLYERGKNLEGSFSSNAQVRCTGGSMYVSCNPARWLTGQNVCGTNDIRLLVEWLYTDICGRLDMELCPKALVAIEKGDVRLSRVDCTFHYHVGSDEDVNHWLSAMATCCHIKHRGRGHYNSGGTTLKFGVTHKEGEAPKSSRRSSFKFYNKFREIGAHPFKCDADLAEKLKLSVQGEVRAEALFRGLELKDKDLHYVRNWQPSTAHSLFQSWIDKMEPSANVELLDHQELELPARLRSTYRHWKNGEDCRSLMSKANFYKHRKDLLALTQIDIALLRAESVKSKRAIPVLEVLTAKPVDETDREKLFLELLARAA